MKSIKTTPSKGLKSKFIKILKSKISTRERQEDILHIVAPQLRKLHWSERQSP